MPHTQHANAQPESALDCSRRTAEPEGRPNPKDGGTQTTAEPQGRRNRCTGCKHSPQCSSVKGPAARSPLARRLRCHAPPFAPMRHMLAPKRRRRGDGMHRGLWLVVARGVAHAGACS
eukprot:360210-Chlamydomonas_euryale.AAC.20